MYQRFISWFRSVTDKPWIMWFLGAVAFFESVIFPIPVDIFTFTLAAAHPKKWLRYGTVATVWSVLGAVFGYLLGAYLFDVFGHDLIAFYGYEDQFLKVTQLFDGSVFLVMFTSAFTPIPYKVFTVAGGAVGVPLFPFIIASILGRGLRFFAETYIPYRFGERTGKVLIKNVNLFTLVLGILVVAYLVLRYTLI